MSFFTTQVTGSIWVKKAKDITAGGTESVDSMAFADFQAAKYIVSAFSKTQNKRLASEVLVIKDGSNVKDIVFSKIRSGLSISISPAVSGGNFNFNVTNNELFAVRVEVARVRLGQ